MTLAILCPGQGNQHAEMFARLFDVPAAQPILQKVSALSGLDLRNLAEAEHSGTIRQNRIAQILVVGQTLALKAALENFPESGLIVAGYSVGDVAAHAVAGSISSADALELAAIRGREMDKAADAAGEPLGMMGIRGLSYRQIGNLTETGVEIALVNGADHFVVGGPVTALDRLERQATAANAHVKRLDVRVASHTSYLRDAGTSFAAALGNVRWQRPAHRLLTPIDGSEVTDSRKAVASLSEQIYVPLDWDRTLRAAREYGVTAALELGAGTALTKMVQESLPEITARAADHFRSLAGLSDWIARQT